MGKAENTPTREVKSPGVELKKKCNANAGAGDASLNFA
jgi:hypothetical protein